MLLLGGAVLGTVVLVENLQREPEEDEPHRVPLRLGEVVAVDDHRAQNREELARGGDGGQHHRVERVEREEDEVLPHSRQNAKDDHGPHDGWEAQAKVQGGPELARDEEGYKRQQHGVDVHEEHHLVDAGLVRLVQALLGWASVGIEDERDGEQDAACVISSDQRVRAFSFLSYYFFIF
jgi:hypothetical protein